MKQLKRLGDRQTITLGQELRHEGKGKLYQVLEIPSLTAKVYHPNNWLPARSEKLELMLADPPENDLDPDLDICLAWPVDLLVCDNNYGEIVGYLMPTIRGAIAIDRYYNLNSLNNKRLGDSSFDSFSLNKSHNPYRAGINLAAALRTIHAKGYVIGDVNESNILVKENGSIVIINTDSFQVCNLAKNVIYYCSTSNPEFTPPELQGKNLTKVHRTPQQDLFGLGILIFKLLMAGTYPYDGIFLSTEEPTARSKLIRFGHFPYGKRKIPFYPPPEAPPFNYLHPRLQELFISCFEKGHSHLSARPTAIDWQEALEQAEKQLLTCNNNPRHRYGSHLSDCPWCDNSLKSDFEEALPKDLPTADRSLCPAPLKKNQPTYKSPRSIASQKKIKPRSVPSVASSFSNLNADHRNSSKSKSWLTPRKKVTIWGLCLVSLLGLWLFLIITVTYPVQSILGTIIIGFLIWTIFKSKPRKK